MEGEKIIMMMLSSSSSSSRCPEDPSTSTTCPPWKLYHNPFYNNAIPQHKKQHRRPGNPRPRLSLSARRIAASFWDLAFPGPTAMKSGDVEEHHEIGENDAMSTQIEKLKAELEHERRARRKAEHANKGLAKDLAEERRGREALERVCEELAKEISCDRASIERMRRDMEEERRMLRMAEVLREERVQMKLAEARIFLEEKISLLENKGSDNHAKNNHNGNHSIPKAMALTVTRKPRRLVLGEKSTSSDDNVSKNGNSSSSNNNNSVIGVTRRAMRAVAAAEAASVSVMKLAVQRKPSPEPENPHIKRGIKGFVEFPRVVRAIGSKSRHWGTKLECQKAQIRILLKQKSPLRSNHLIWGK